MSRFANWRTKRRERIRLRCQRMARRSNEVQAAARMLRLVDADTMRWRALQDARGMVLREGCTYRADSVTTWQLRRSVAGRINQVDLLVNGALWRTGSLRAACHAIRRGKRTSRLITQLKAA